MLKMLILICSSSVSPAECGVDTASDVIHGPNVAGIMACGLGGQVMVAETAGIGRHPGDYLKVACIPLDRETPRLKAALAE
jgi:hypothetical protein